MMKSSNGDWVDADEADEEIERAVKQVETVKAAWRSDRELLSAAKDEIIALRSELGNAYGTQVVCSAIACEIEDRLRQQHADIE